MWRDVNELVSTTALTAAWLVSRHQLMMMTMTTMAASSDVNELSLRVSPLEGCRERESHVTLMACTCSPLARRPCRPASPLIPHSSLSLALSLVLVLVLRITWSRVTRDVTSCTSNNVQHRDAQHRDWRWSSIRHTVIEPCTATPLFYFTYLYKNN